MKDLYLGLFGAFQNGQVDLPIVNILTGITQEDVFSKYKRQLFGGCLGKQKIINNRWVIDVNAGIGYSTYKYDYNLSDLVNPFVSFVLPNENGIAYTGSLAVGYYFRGKKAVGN